MLVYFMQYNSEVGIDRPPHGQYTSVLAPLTGQLLVRHREQEFAAGAHGTQAPLSAGESPHLELSAECSILGVHAEAASLTETMRQLTPEITAPPLQFESAIVDPPACRAL
jgi:hypothetical protein